MRANKSDTPEIRLNGQTGEEIDRSHGHAIYNHTPISRQGSSDLMLIRSDPSSPTPDSHAQSFFNHTPISRQGSGDSMICKHPSPNVDQVPGCGRGTLPTVPVLENNNNAKSTANPDYDSLMMSSWLGFAGHCPGLDSFLNSRTSSLWVPFKFVDALLRGVSQVVFANNPITGLLITLALFWADWIVGSAAVVAAAVAILTAYVIGQESANIRAGLTTYSAVLVGCVTASIWTPVYSEPIPLTLWAFVAVGSSLSVFLTSALANIFSSFKIPLPCLTMPFNIVNLLLFTCFMPPAPSSVLVKAPVSNGIASFNMTDSNTTSMDKIASKNLSPEVEFEVEELEYVKILTGILCSMGQIYGVQNIFASILMYIGVLIYSPIMALMAFVGSSIGTLSGLVFVTGPPYTTIYAGIWGYNAILSATAIGGFFIAINWLSFFSAIANVILTVIIQQGLVHAFHDLRLPVFTLPFVLSTLLFLSISSTNEGLSRVKNITFPELHRMEYVKKMKENIKSRVDNLVDLTEVIVGIKSLK